MRTHILTHRGEEFECVQFFDTELGEGVDVRHPETDTLVCEIVGLSIPDDPSDLKDKSTLRFIKKVTESIEATSFF